MAKSDVVGIVLGLAGVVAAGSILMFINSNTAQSGEVKKSGCGCSAKH